MPLTEQEDAYGHMLLDLVAGVPAAEIIERDDGYIIPGALAAHYIQPYDAWPSHQRAVVDRARGRVLDIGCGAGRFCLALQERGHPVTGIDVSPGAVEACRRRGVLDVRPVALEEIDASLGTFDTVVMMGNNFGLFGDAAGLRSGLDRLAAVTAPDALLYAEAVDPYATSDPLHLRYHQANRDAGRLGGELRIRIRYKVWASPWFGLLLPSADELDTLLADTAWTVRDAIPAEAGPVRVVVLAKDTP